eukprot:8569710-Heterocapsa_arctica.AAC.1
MLTTGCLPTSLRLGHSLSRPDAPRSALRSARSLPMSPEWPLTHSKVTLFALRTKSSRDRTAAMKPRFELGDHLRSAMEA